MQKATISFNPRERLLWPVLLFACAVPLLLVEFPPLVDLFGHLGRYAIQTQLAERPELQPYFSYQWQLVGNLGADLVVELLAPILGLEPTVGLIVLATQLLAASGILAISTALHGRITPFAVCALPLIYAFPFQYGFLNFSLSMALAMLVFAAWLHLRQSQVALRAPLFLAVAGLTVWLCHAFGWAFLGLLCGSASLHARWTEGLRGADLVLRVLSDCGVLLLAIVPMLVWRTGSAGADTTEWSVLLKIVWLVSVFRSGPPMLDWLSAGFLAAVVLAGFVLRPVRVHGAMAIAALFCIGAFMALPARVFGSFYADMRLVPYTLIVALLALSGSDLSRSLQRVMFVAALAFLGLRIGATSVDFVDKDRLVQANLPALDVIPRGARVVNFAVEQCGFQWRLNPLRHLGGFAIARRSAFTNDQWEMAGANALTVHYPEGESFVRDPSQSVVSVECADSGLPALAHSLSNVPRDAFTHIWIHGIEPDAVALPFPASEIWRGESGIVFEINR
ncbi:hypothetical protein Q9K02_11695 [Qipengyuania sp. G39]|uniref:Glycosyltransferase RgtA/B/C/D-like domain-containing protein n=1 Tax=Qipengyuania profundimaris TaxID=3067652 RepID=A0ABT9HRP7_9SPHN|nr:hypothetical protein [Qipengyuania sp. G39]MDP4575805.1 hypothetical protein [Qipengyuania sp. G39]